MKEIDFPSYKKGWKEFDKNNKTIALNILYISYTTEEIKHAYMSKHNLKHENQVIFLMITDGEKWHYLAVEKLSALLKGITSKHKRVCEDHDYCYVEMPEKILKYNYGEKSMKTPFIIYVDLESLLEKMSTRHNNPENN